VVSAWKQKLEKTMFRILQRSEQQKGAIAAVEFEGAPYDAGVSFFVGDLEPGKGPGLHKHPYSETCIIHSGQVEAIIDGEVVVAVAGDILVIKPETPHRFTAIGEERLLAVCIHASDRFIIDWLSDDSVREHSTVSAALSSSTA
jgi:quercetin dioxygenase-like cupin family protein